MRSHPRYWGIQAVNKTDEANDFMELTFYLGGVGAGVVVVVEVDNNQ